MFPSFISTPGDRASSAIFWNTYGARTNIQICGLTDCRGANFLYARFCSLLVLNSYAAPMTPDLAGETYEHSALWCGMDRVNAFFLGQACGPTTSCAAKIGTVAR